MSRLLVTGGAGFIGSNFIRYWLANHPGDQLINLDALTYAGNLESLSNIEQQPNYRFVHGDITDAEPLARLFRDGLGLPNALYFDGRISRLHAPSLGRSDRGAAMGPIVGVQAD